jgi:hypothetical protein
MDHMVNVQPSGWSSLFPNAATPLTPALSTAFDIPRTMPARLVWLLKQLDRRRRN